MATNNQPESNKEVVRYSRITDEAVAELLARRGQWHPVEQPFNAAITEDGIRHYVRAIGDRNPLWTDPTQGGASPWTRTAPPGYLYSVHWGSWDFRRGRGLPGVHGLHSGDRWHWFRPLRLGTPIRARRSLVGLDEKHGKYAGRSFLQRDVIRIADPTDNLLALCYMSSMRVERDEGRSRGTHRDVALGRYSPEELHLIEDGYDKEQIRGSEKRLWEDVEIGDKIGPIVMGPYTSADSIAWVMGVGSPHIRIGQFWLDYRRRTPAIAVLNPETGVPEPVERVHWDNYMAAEIGMPKAYDYGAQRGALASRLMTDWMGDAGFLKLIDVQYRAMVFLGDTLWLEGEVARKFVDGDNRFVECNISARNQRGERPLHGTAIVALPTAKSGIKVPVVLSSDASDRDPMTEIPQPA